MIPLYLKNNIIIKKEKKDKTIGILQSSTGNTELEIYYYGDIYYLKKRPYIVDSQYPCLVKAVDPITKEEFTIYDGMIHGYEAMFCIENSEENIKRELKPFQFRKGKIEIILYYGIDYEEEKDDYEFDREGNVILTYGKLNWEEAKSIGYDFIELRFVHKKTEFLSMELA